MPSSSASWPLTRVQEEGLAPSLRFWHTKKAADESLSVSPRASAHTPSGFELFPLLVRASHLGGSAAPLSPRTQCSRPRDSLAQPNPNARTAWQLPSQPRASFPSPSQTNDLPTQLHHALFELDGGQGYVLKPLEMRQTPARWPPPRQHLTRVTMRLISLHRLPTRAENRPRVHMGAHMQCHSHVPHLSGKTVPPKAGMVSSPSLQVGAPVASPSRRGPSRWADPLHLVSGA